MIQEIASRRQFTSLIMVKYIAYLTITNFKRAILTRKLLLRRKLIEKLNRCFIKPKINYI